MLRSSSNHVALHYTKWCQRLTNNNPRLLVLRVLVKLMVLFAISAFLWVLVGPESNSRSDPESLEVTRYDVSDMQPGDHRIVEWNSKPLLIVYRTPEWERALVSADANLYHDPLSRHSVQPVGAKNALRSAQAGWFVTLAIGTGIGCSLSFETSVITRLDDNEQTSVQLTTGGLIDDCDRSRFDLAGRAYKDQNAKKNTVVPNWQHKENEIVVEG